MSDNNDNQTYTRNLDIDLEDSCVICLCGLYLSRTTGSEPYDVTAYSCRHAFHTKCITQLRSQPTAVHLKCPTCRAFQEDLPEPIPRHLLRLPGGRKPEVEEETPQEETRRERRERDGRALEEMRREDERDYERILPEVTAASDREELAGYELGLFPFGGILQSIILVMTCMAVMLLWNGITVHQAFYLGVICAFPTRLAYLIPFGQGCRFVVIVAFMCLFYDSCVTSALLGWTVSSCVFYYLPWEMLRRSLFGSFANLPADQSASLGTFRSYGLVQYLEIAYSVAWRLSVAFLVSRLPAVVAPSMASVGMMFGYWTASTFFETLFHPSRRFLYLTAHAFLLSVFMSPSVTGWLMGWMIAQTQWAYFDRFPSGNIVERHSSAVYRAWQRLSRAMR